MTMELALKPAAARGLAAWHAVVTSLDADALGDLLRADVVFRSPMAHKPYHGALAASLVLGTVMQVFTSFTYHRQFASEDGCSVALEFSAVVNGRELEGVDLIRFDDEGRIAEFEVMVRPMSGLQALGEEMGRRVGATLPAFKAQGS
jgi:hypothetical protein